MGSWPKNPVARLRTYFANSLPTIKSADLNALQDFALERTTPTIDKSMNGHKYIDLADGVNDGDAVHAGQFGSVLAALTGHFEVPTRPAPLVAQWKKVANPIGVGATIDATSSHPTGAGVGVFAAVTVTFPSAFANACLFVIPFNSSGGPVIAAVDSGTYATTGCTIGFFNADSTRGVGITEMTYLAVGY